MPKKKKFCRIDFTSRCNKDTINKKIGFSEMTNNIDQCFKTFSDDTF